MSIQIRNLTKKFGQVTVCDHLNLDIPSGELVALLGPSGSGKTSLLRIIAGLEQPDEGSVLFHGEDTTQVSVRERQVGFVFQHYALFAHMTIFENVAFGLRVRPKASRPSDADIKQKVTELLKLVQLDWIADRYPHQLSGASVSASRWHGRSRSSPRCFCSTSPSARWTPRCARNCAAGCAACTTRCTSPASSSPTTRKKPWKWPTASS